MNLSRLLAVFRRPDERERRAQDAYRASLAKAVAVMPGDERLRRLLEEADQLMKSPSR